MRHSATTGERDMNTFQDLAAFPGSLQARRLKRATLVSVTLIGMLCPFLSGQDHLSPAQRESLGVATVALPGDLLLQVRAVGDRMARRGKEATLLDGQLLGSGPPKSVQVLHQLSGMVRIDGISKRGPLTFDGDISHGLSGPVDQSLLEAFVVDSVEGMIHAAQTGAHVRLIGRGFGPDPLINPEYKGVRYDIYEVIAPDRLRQDRKLTMKRYYFDSSTGLLLSTRYSDPSYSPPLRVETRFSDWDQGSGSAYPKHIEHFENGNLVFSFVVSTASSQSRHDITKFR
jgi:hypothetical protein